MMFLLVAVCFLLSTFQAQSRSIKDILEKSCEENEKSTEQDDQVSVSTKIERANKYAGQRMNEPSIVFGDIAVTTGLITDPCTAYGCKWQRSKNGKVFVPYVISDKYSSEEKDVILQGLRSFEKSTCIRFTPHTKQRDYINIQSNTGCYSFVGRRIGGQTVSLDRAGCISLSIVQHEMLHALGFHHEQNRSDRDNHVQILSKNIIPGLEHNFNKIKTNNLETAYDYSSVMHYGRFAFSKNKQPTIIPVPHSKVSIGQAEKMSSNDILRINRLYCKWHRQSMGAIKIRKLSLKFH